MEIKEASTIIYFQSTPRLPESSQGGSRCIWKRKRGKDLILRNSGRRRFCRDSLPPCGEGTGDCKFIKGAKTVNEVHYYRVCSSFWKLITVHRRRDLHSDEVFENLGVEDPEMDRLFLWFSRMQRCLEEIVHCFYYRGLAS